MSSSKEIEAQNTYIDDRRPRIAAGDRINHKCFGYGIVEDIIWDDGSEYLEVTFTRSNKVYKIRNDKNYALDSGLLTIISHDYEFLKSRGVQHLVHFTPAENVKSILQNGLRPRKTLDAEGIEYTYTDSKRLEGNHVVNLSITNPNINMFYGKRKDAGKSPFCVLLIDPAILNTDIKRFYTSTNAASRRGHCSVEDLFRGYRPHYFRTHWTTDNQAEVLLEGTLAPSYIQSIQLPKSLMYDWDAKQLAEELANQVEELGLNCTVEFCEEHFYYNTAALGKEDKPEPHFEHYPVYASSNRASFAAIPDYVDDVPASRPDVPLAKKAEGSSAKPAENKQSEPLKPTTQEHKKKEKGFIGKIFSGIRVAAVSTLAIATWLALCTFTLGLMVGLIFFGSDLLGPVGGFIGLLASMVLLIRSTDFILGLLDKIRPGNKR